MSNTPVNNLPLRLVPDEAEPAGPLAHPSDGARRVGLDVLHREVANAFITEPSAELLALTADAATALGSGTDRERNEARIRLAARIIAVGRMQMQTLELGLTRSSSRGSGRSA
jgi:hypothetical protein